MAAVNIEESCATAVAAALCIVIVITSAAVKALHVLADRFLLGVCRPGAAASHAPLPLGGEAGEGVMQEATFVLHPLNLTSPPRG